MIEHEDVLYRPVLRGLLDPRALTDGSISLGEIALLNEAIDIQDENQHRAQKAVQRKQEADERRKKRR